MMTDVDDIQSFIAAQKKRIQQERNELVLNNVGRRNVAHQRPSSPKLSEANSTNIQRPEQPKATTQDSSSPRGLSFGAYESVQEKLKKERAEEYKKFLAQKNYRSTGANPSRDTIVEKSSLKSALHKPDDIRESPGRDFNDDDLTSLNTQRNRQQAGHLNGITTDTYRPRAQNKTYEELYDAYQELLERKRQDERTYRGLIDDPYSDPRRVRFDEESRLGRLYMDTWLDQSQRGRRDTQQPDVSRQAGRKRWDDEGLLEKPRDDSYQTPAPVKKETPDRISRSAPQQAVPLFGEHDVTPEVKHERQAKYREELQAQMKEREMQKKREKSHVFIGTQDKEETGRVFPSNANPVPQGYHRGSSRPQEMPPQPAQLGGFTQPYYSPLLQAQAYNYPAGLLANAGLMPTTLNPGGLLGGYPTSFREPVGGYQPSWANGPVQPGRLGGLGPSLGEVEPRIPETRAASVSGLGPSKYGDFGEHVGVLPYHETKKGQDKSRQQSYREELTRQMQEKETRKKHDKEAVERYRVKLEKEIQEYDPWGKSGGGAPIKDGSGRLVSDLRQMRQYNKEGTIISPRERTGKPGLYLDKESLSTSNDKPSFDRNTSSTVGMMDSVRQPIETDDPQKKAKLEYQDYLRKQVEEKQRKKKEEEDRLREIESREDKIIMEQQLKLKSEYEQELEATRKKEEAARQKNEEIRLAAEQKKKEMEEKRLEEERKHEEKLRKQLDERLKAATGKQVDRSGSPPIPTLQNQQRSNSPPIPTLQAKSPPAPASQAQPRSSSPPIPTLQNQPRSNSPPIPTLQQNKKPARPVSRGHFQRENSVEKQLSRPSSNTSRGRTRTPSFPSTPNKETNQETSRHRVPSATADIDVLSQLTSLRRQLKHEEVKVQQQLTENQEKFLHLRENSGKRRSKKPVANVFDNALRRTPATTHRDLDTKNFGAMEEFNKMKYEDTSSLSGDFISRYPDPATSASTLELQQQSLLKEQQRRLQVFRDRLMTNDKENVEYLGNRTRPDSKTSQLESDSQFVSVEDPSKVLLEQGGSSKPPNPLPSARERRRWKQMAELVKTSKLTSSKPPTPGGFSLNSVTSFNVDEIAQKNEERLRRLETMKQARSETKGDPNEVLKKFIEKHSRPDSKVSENSLPADKQHIPNV